MNVEMTPLQIIGLKQHLPRVLQSLRDLGCVQIDNVSETPEISARPLSLDRDTRRHQEQLSYLVARIEGVLELLEDYVSDSQPCYEQDCFEEARAQVELLLPRVQKLATRRDELTAELASLPRYEATLRKLLPITPPSAAKPENITVGILVDRVHIGILETIGKRLLELTAGRAELTAGDVDATTRAMLVVFPAEFAEEVEGLLGQEDVSRLRLPEQLGGGPPETMLAELQRRQREIPAEIADIEGQLQQLASDWSSKLAGWRDVLRDQIEANRVLSNLGETDTTFVIMGWTPAHKVHAVTAALQEAVGDTLFVQPLTLTPALRQRAPVILDNPAPARPFESLVSLLSLPRYGHIDPTRLMALFMPIFFGMIVGDVGYGALLLLLALLLRRRFRAGVARDLTVILAMGAAWSILFGFLFGELFGTLGEQLGLHALWFDRASAEHISSLLILSLAVGAAHVILGLVLGLWEAARDRSRSHLLERGGMLLGLISLFFLVAVLARMLPEALLTPAVAGLIVGIVLLGSSLGWLGLLMGPIEFLGLLGNILSYLRIAAIGLASVYLAQVANEMAGTLGNLIVGVIVAVLIHALNVALGAFSPTIHSMRLHYVEFFRKFYEGGGRPYRPFKSNLPQIKSH